MKTDNNLVTHSAFLDTPAKCAKGELISNLVDSAREKRGVLRRLAARVELESAPQASAVATR
jgi:hypothetical protein